MYAPQSVLSLEEAPVPPNTGSHNPIVCKTTNYFTNHDCNLELCVSSSVRNGVDSGTGHRSGVRASDNILVVSEPDRRRGTKEDNIGNLGTSKCVLHYATPGTHVHTNTEAKDGSLKPETR